MSDTPLNASPRPSEAEGPVGILARTEAGPPVSEMGAHGEGRLRGEGSGRPVCGLFLRGRFRDAEVPLPVLTVGPQTSARAKCHPASPPHGELWPRVSPHGARKWKTLSSPVTKNDASSRPAVLYAL